MQYYVTQELITGEPLKTSSRPNTKIIYPVCVTPPDAKNPFFPFSFFLFVFFGRRKHILGTNAVATMLPEVKSLTMLYKVSVY